MQVLTATCPYCENHVDSTIDHLDGPIVCPNCEKPFEMEMPTAVVTSVAEVENSQENNQQLAGEPDERTLAKVHPVVFRARPLAAFAVILVALAALAVFVFSLAGMTVAGVAFGESPVLGPISLLTWVGAIMLLMIVGLVGYWGVDSRFTTLTVTDDRTIYREGIISRETSEVQHDDVRNIQLDQSFVQRLLNVGGIAVSSSGQDDLEVVAKRLPDPERIIRLIRENQD